ncbi:MAG: thiamine ABC transporter substrate-binding protein [Anaerolineales bacterium]|jgi:thiamine transport system substrate-binding protein
MMKRSFVTLITVLILLSACSGGGGDTTEEGLQSLTVMTHDSFAVSDDVLAAFQEANHVKVSFIESGDTGTAVNSAVLAAGKPFADVFYGVDNTFLSRTLKAELFEPYQSPLLAGIPQEFQLDPQHRVLPVDYGDVCLNYDKLYFEEHQLSPPASLEDLLSPEYAGMLAVPNPASSSPGLAFLLTTIGHFGEDGYLDYWRGLVENDLKVVNDWETVYNTEFSRWGGTRPVVVSYGSSPPFEVIYAQEPMDTPPTGVITADGSCYRQIEFVGILKGTEKRALAEKWVDFMLSTTFQEDMPLQMYVFPVNPEAKLDQAFLDFLAVPDNPVMLDPALITENREKWINDWRETVLQ